MSKILSIMLIVIFTIALGFGILAFLSAPVDSKPCPEKCHLIYDPYDHIWWCIGSPDNCCCSKL